MKNFTLSYLFVCVFVTIIFFVDWYFISLILQQQPFISHWTILFPMIVPLFFTFGLAGLGGIYLRKFWGFLITYLVLLFLILMMISFYIYLYQYHLMNINFLEGMILCNVLVLAYVIYFEVREKKNSRLP